MDAMDAYSSGSISGSPNRFFASHHAVFVVYITRLQAVALCFLPLSSVAITWVWNARNRVMSDHSFSSGAILLVVLFPSFSSQWSKSELISGRDVFRVMA